jgi:hypothetical protein
MYVYATASTSITTKRTGSSHDACKMARPITNGNPSSHTTPSARSGGSRIDVQTDLAVALTEADDLETGALERRDALGASRHITGGSVLDGCVLSDHRGSHLAVHPAERRLRMHLAPTRIPMLRELERAEP